jgi:PAS domain S-box-containing protein
MAESESIVGDHIELAPAPRRVTPEVHSNDFEDFFENSAAAMHLVAGDGMVLWVNRAELDLLGYSREEYVGRHINEFHADRPTIDDILTRLSFGEKIVKYPARLRAKDGAIKHVIISSNAQFRDGKFVNTRCVTIDVTSERGADEALRESEARLSAELDATRQLQEISAALIHDEGVEALYNKLVDAAAAIMRADFASMQMFYPERGEKGELRLLAFRGFDPEAAKFWEWVGADSGCTCGQAFRTGRRAIASDVKSCDFMAGTPDRTAYLQAGMNAAQSTPLVSRTGRLLGMLSTHWRKPHNPTESDLRRFDVLARQAADLIERKLADEQKNLLLGEMSHRIKNLFAVTSGLVSLSARSARTIKEMAESIQERLGALTRAHALTRPGLLGAGESLDQKTTLHTLIHTLFAPYVTDRSKGLEGIVLTGPDLPIGETAITSIALVLHELATNAAKYGALSRPGGVVHIDCSTNDDKLLLTWKELGGPALAGEPDGEGFGGLLTRRVINEQFGGELSRDWQADGLNVRLSLPLSRLSI